jgi:hypothetical protein
MEHVHFCGILWYIHLYVGLNPPHPREICPDDYKQFGEKRLLLSA